MSVPQPPLRGSRRLSLLQIAIGALLGSILTILVPWTIRSLSQKSSADELSRMAAKFGPIRLTLGRMDGQSTFAPYPTLVRQQDTRSLARFCRPVKPDTAPSVEAFRKRAFCALAGSNYDVAIAALDEAIELQPDNAALASDLSALYGERGRREDRPEDFVTSLELAKKATSILPEHPESVFNHAVALENLFLGIEARKEWQRYRTIDPDSPWAKEAFIIPHLTRAPRLPEMTRLGSTDGLVYYTANGPSESEIPLPAWTEVLALQDHVPRSRMIRRLANAMRSLNSPRVPASLLARIGLEQFRQKEIFLNPCTHNAKWGLPSIQGTETLAAKFRQAVCHLQQNDDRGAQKLLDQLAKNSQLADYPSLQARRFLVLGLLAQKRTAFSEGLGFYHRALDIFYKIGEDQNGATAQNLIAEILDLLGQGSEAWRFRYRVLAWAQGGPPTPQLHVALDQAVLASLRQGRPEAALDFQDLLAKVCLKVHGPLGSISTRLRSAQIKAALGKREAASKDLDAATKSLQDRSVPSKELHSLAARIDVVRSEIATKENRATAIARDLSPHQNGQSIDLLSARADFDFRRGATEAAESDLREAIEQMEQQREKVAPGAYRISLLDQAQPIYERMVALQLHLGQPAKALDFLERFRARTLLDQVQGLSPKERGDLVPSHASAAPLSWQELCRSLPPHTVIIIYGVVENQLIAWSVLPSGVQLALEQPWDSSFFSDENLSIERGRGPYAIRQTLRRLGERLILPWIGRIPRADRIIFVPTRSLYKVPFAALINPSSNRFLVQDHPIGIAPSASEFITAVERDRSLSARPVASVLLIGNPVRQSSDFLPPLPAAKREIEYLNRLYHGLKTEVLTGKEANRTRVLASMPEFEILHLAIHAVPDEKDSYQARFLLSPSLGDYSGDLYAEDVLQLHLDHTRLVVLAACQTQAGPISPSEGALSFSSAFLAAGVPAVVGSIWPIDDRSTERFSVRLHKKLRQGMDAISALRTAQLEEIEEQQGRDWTWASFQVIGGVAERHSGKPAQVEPGEKYAARR